MFSNFRAGSSWQVPDLGGKMRDSYCLWILAGWRKLPQARFMLSPIPETSGTIQDSTQSLRHHQVLSGLQVGPAPLPLCLYSTNPQDSCLCVSWYVLKLRHSRSQGSRLTTLSLQHLPSGPRYTRPVGGLCSCGSFAGEWYQNNFVL